MSTIAPDAKDRPKHNGAHALPLLEVGDDAPANLPAVLEKEPTPAEPADSDHTGDDFDWLNDESVVLEEQPATAVYRNRAGGLVIRQQRAWDEEADPCIVIAAASIDEFLEAVINAAGIPSIGSPTKPVPVRG